MSSVARRDLTLVVSGAGVSAFGSSLTLLILLITAKPLGSVAVAAILIAQLAPIILVAPLAGALVDRYPNRRLLVVSLAAQGVVTALVAMALGSLAVMVACLAVSGAFAALSGPCTQALVPNIVGDEQAPVGYSWIATARTAGTLVGAAAGGVLFTLVGGRTSLLIDAATFIVEAALVALVTADRVPRAANVGADGRPAKSNALAGFSMIFSDRTLAVVVSSLSLAVVATILVNVAAVFYVFDELDGNGLMLGLLNAGWMIGMIIGARTSAKARTERAMTGALGAATVLMGLALVTPAFLVLVPAMAAGYVLGGLANGVQNVTIQSLTKLRISPDRRGRAFAVLTAALLSANVLGIAAGASIVTLFGPRTTFGVAGLATVAAGVFSLVALRPWQHTAEPESRKLA